jgi:Domain of unknown function (DUF5602)
MDIFLIIKIFQMRENILMAAAAATVILLSCKKDDDDRLKDGLLYGSEIQVGNGNARSFFEPDSDGHPKAIGIAMDEAALDNLPGHETFFLLPVPEEVRQATPYSHISLDWNPHGHGPAPIYDKPHFDMHFYMIDEGEKNSIDTTKPELNILPDSFLMPSFYVPEPGGIPKMGKHWVDITSPELNPVNPAPFTTTFIYGSYNGKVIFHEPMITRAYLLSKPDTTISIRQPVAFAQPGHYPTKYQITFDNAKKQWRIILKGFEHR